MKIRSWLTPATLLLSANLLAHAQAKVAVNRPYVQAIQGGPFYARCIPADKFGSAGFTEIYRVGMEQDQRLTRYEWYSREGLVLGWSPIAGQVGVMAKRRERNENFEKQIELSFFLRGTHLRSWTTGELKKLGATVDEKMRDEHSGPGASFQMLGCDQVDNSNEYTFSIQFTDGKKVAFDILTGEPYRPHQLTQEEAVRLAKETASIKGVKVENYNLLTTSFDARAGCWRIFYTHKPPGYPGGHFTVEINDQTRATRFIGGK